MGRAKIIAMHAGVWTLYSTVAIFCYGYPKGNWSACIDEISLTHLQSAGVFYTTTLFVLPRLWAKKKYALTVILMLSVLILSIGLGFFFSSIVSPDLFSTTISSVSKGVDVQAVSFSFQWFTFTAFAILYWNKDSIIALQKREAQLTADKAGREILELENAALRAQINPHFTFNTLEHLRALTMDSAPEASYGIGSFMRILRAGITTPDIDGKIPLKIETEAIKATIFIFEQRFPEIALNYQLYIRDIDNVRILPHILLPFIENAFKHGEYRDNNHKIQLCLSANQHLLRLIVINKKGKWIKDNSTGIGLKYVKRHLKSGYKDVHHLIINETEETFFVDLSVQLN